MIKTTIRELLINLSEYQTSYNNLLVYVNENELLFINLEGGVSVLNKCADGLLTYPSIPEFMVESGLESEDFITVYFDVDVVFRAEVTQTKEF